MVNKRKKKERRRARAVPIFVVGPVFSRGSSSSQYTERLEKRKEASSEKEGNREMEMETETGRKRRRTEGVRPTGPDTAVGRVLVEKACASELPWKQSALVGRESTIQLKLSHNTAIAYHTLLHVVCE